jgi:hypothetical protein
MTVIVIRCDRYGRRCRNPAFVTDEWNATLRQGVVVGYLCPDCQTPEENAEAAIHEGWSMAETTDDGSCAHGDRCHTGRCDLHLPLAPQSWASTPQ